MAISLQTRCLQKTKKSKQTEFNKLKSKQSRRPGINKECGTLSYTSFNSRNPIAKKEKKTQQEIKLSEIWLELIRDCEQG